MADGLGRVKVYVLIEDEHWKDLGTGQISSRYIERLQGVCLVVYSESNDELILESKVHPNVPYKKQQGDLIIWSEAKNHGMALHFQHPNVCQDIWEDICHAQGKDPGVNITQDISNDSERFNEMPKIWNLFEVPNCELEALEKIANLFTLVLDNPSHKERLALILESENYIQKLLQMFHTCELLHNTEGLHHLHDIIKGILFLNRTPLLKIMFSDECIMDVVGCLEYDPALNEPKRHREFLTQNAKLKEVVPITHPELKQKIYQTYRVQYIYDILFPTPSTFEETLITDITDFIFCNKTKIVTMILQDEMFLFEIFSQLRDNTIDVDRWRYLLFFFKEFCEFFQTLQPQNKNALLNTLIKLGIMYTLKVSMSMDDYQIKVAALDIFAYLVEYNPCMVREYVLEEAQECEDDELLVNNIIEQMTGDTEPYLASTINLMGILQYLLDPETMQRTANICEKSEFLNFFYKRCMNNLVAPLLSATSLDNDEDKILELDKDKNCFDNYQTAQLLALILELLTFCVQHHTFYIKNYILNKNLLKTVMALMNSKHTFLILYAVRFMRVMIGLNDELLNHYIMKRNFFEPLVNTFLLNGTRYNMLNSAIIEIFECIRVENIKSLVTHIVEKFYQAFESIEYVQTFKGLKIKYEEEKERENQIRKTLQSTIYRKIQCSFTKLTKVRVKEETCSKGKRKEVASSTMGKDFPNQHDMFMKIKGEKETGNNVGSRKRTSSGGFKFSSTAGAHRTSKPQCNTTGPLVDYSDDDNDGGSGGGCHDDEDEDEEKIPPKKRSDINS